MAKLNVLPDTATIIAMRGRVDFYEWKMMPVARAWPSRRKGARSPGEIRSSEVFVASVKMTGALDPRYADLVRDAWGGGTGVTWVDAFRALSRARGWYGTLG